MIRVIVFAFLSLATPPSPSQLHLKQGRSSVNRTRQSIQEPGRASTSVEASSEGPNTLRTLRCSAIRPWPILAESHSDVLKVRRRVVAARDENAILVARSLKDFGDFWTKWLLVLSFAFGVAFSV